MTVTRKRPVRTIATSARVSSDRRGSQHGLALLVVLLNLTGAGFGYLVLRRWRRWAAYVAATFSLLAVAVLTDASEAPRLWTAILAVWAVGAAYDGLRCVRGSVPHQPRHLWAVAATAVLVLVVQAELVSGYRAAGHQALRTAVAAEARGDCRSEVVPAVVEVVVAVPRLRPTGW